MAKYAVGVQKNLTFFGTIAVDAPNAEMAMDVVDAMMAGTHPDVEGPLQTDDNRIEWSTEGQYVDFTFEMCDDQEPEEVK